MRSRFLRLRIRPTNRDIPRADDGTLPLPGDCEAATATLRLDGSRDRFVAARKVELALTRFGANPQQKAGPFAGFSDHDRDV